MPAFRRDLVCQVCPWHIDAKPSKSQALSATCQVQDLMWMQTADSTNVRLRLAEQSLSVSGQRDEINNRLRYRHALRLSQS